MKPSKKSLGTVKPSKKLATTFCRKVVAKEQDGSWCDGTHLKQEVTKSWPA